MGISVLALEVKLLKEQILEDCAVFRADFNARKAVYDSKLRNLLASLNGNLGEVEEKEDIWYSADDQRYLPLMSSVSWKAEMNGYSIFDPGEGTGILWETKYDAQGVPLELTDYEETDSREPGVRLEIMNLHASEIGAYKEIFSLDIKDVQDLIDDGISIISALHAAEDHQENIGGNEVLEIGYEANVEDQAWLIDNNFSRGYCDAEDSWDNEQALRKELSRLGPNGICPDRASYMRLNATKRNDRFVRELNFIACSSPKDVCSRYAWNRDRSRCGAFWRTVYTKHANKPEPGLQWLTNSHTVLLTFAYKRKLGQNISNGLLRAATNAADNVSEQMKEHCGLEDFNLADIEGHINGCTPYFEQLGKYYANRG